MEHRTTIHGPTQVETETWLGITSTKPGVKTSNFDGEPHVSVTEGQLTPPVEEVEVWQEVAAQCQCPLQDLEDVYPCTAAQEGMMALTAKDHNAYTLEYVFYLPPGTDPTRLEQAWRSTALANPILRSRIVPTSQSGCIQAVVRGSIPWQVHTDDDGIPCMTSGTVVWRPGAPLAYFVLNWPRRVLTMIIHHSICDDWSISVLLREVDAAYNGKQLENRPFRPLAEYIKANRARSERFWKTEFHDSHKASMTPFPPLPTAGYTPRPTERLEKTFDTHSGPTAGFTVNTKLRLAWAMVQSLYTGSEDTFFGTVNAGRGVPVPGVQEMSGPALATVPVRVQINPNHTVMEALDAVQGQWAATMQFEHVGLQRLMHLGPGPQAACRFQTLMSVEPRDGHQIHGVLSQHRSEQHTYDSYAVILLVRPSSRTVWLEARFDPAVIEVQQMERVLSQMAYIYQQIERKPNILLAEINTVSPEDRTELTRRNTSNISSSAPPLCVHQLIQQRASQQPLAVAINSWDGDISYQKLDDMSSELAVHLSQQSVGPGVFVPLCLGKTKWMAVAMLAVMKTGAAFTLLDPSYPTSRLLNMCQKINATVIVTLESQVPVASRLGVPTVVSMGNLNLEKNNSDSPPESASSPMDPIYAAFTSGSTGNPKCAIVNHAGFTASALAHSEPCHFTPQSRVLQFASPAFDLCILEHLSTLIMGGCLCIPSAADCHSNLTEAMNKFAVNVALLTPTVSRIVSPGSISTLKVLVFCGETVRASDVSRWEQHVEVRNAYGPAECSVIFSVQPHPRSEDPGNIGFSTGCVGWVVHPEDHCRLMPLGCPGELVIEGPIVGDGYLSDSEETARAFIEAPPWRREFAAIPTRLLYRTGDLVECTGDGSFRFIGRKDTQVKLHGQRLELADVEHHLHRSFPEARQAIADILRSSHESGHGDGRPKTLLVAFVCLPLSSSAEKEEHEESLFHPPNDEFRAACAIAESRLSETLPSFMVPAVFLPLSHMPQTKSGKADRRYLLGQAELLPWERIQEFRVTRGQPQMPSGEREEKLQQIWARTLNRAAHEIGINESFFRLGGDSVSAMQVAASCKTSGFNVTVADIFRHPTISKLAQKVQESRRNPQFLPKTVQEDPIDKLFHLSPIQQLFFEHVPDGHNKFTQEFLLRVTKPASSSKIRKAIEEIVTQHSMLRARFEQDSDGNWGQIVRRDVATSFHLHEHRISSIDNHDHLQKMFSASQSMLDIQHGPMFVVDVIETDGHEQYLGLMAHHLVIDMVSWRVLFQNLEDILSMDCPSQPVSMPFQQWCRLQKEYAAESLDPQTALSTNIPAAPLGYWGPPAIWESNTVGDAVEQSISISQETTQWILGPANDAFQTRPVEIIQTAVLYAFLLAFDNRPAPTIFSEGHGREPWGQHIDISQTVGWFTTIAPIFVRAKKGQNFAELLQLTKDSRRANPRNGWDYFATRYLHPEGMYYCQGHAQMEVLFNYLSLFQQLERPGALLQLQSIPDQDIIQPPSDLPRFALIDVTAKVVNGCLSVVFLYNKRLRHQDRLQKWAQLCLQTLEELPKTLQQDHQLTISDFPLLSLTTDGQLQDLLHQIPCQLKVPVSDIEDIYPCSPVQLGMWLSQVKNPRMYWSHIKWSIYPLSSVSVDIEKIKAAWRRVVDRHAILRTVFTDGTGRLSHPLQIVLRSTQVDVQVISQSESIAENEIPSLSDQFLMTQSLMNKKGQPPHHLKLTIQQDGEVSCDLTIHHMLVDGVTVQILLNDVYRAYDGQLEHSPAAGYSKYLRYLQGDHQTSSETYWKQYLEDVHPCIFPSLGIKVQGREQLTLKLVPFSFDIGRRLQSFCQHHGITISNLLQVAWGLLLRTYTGSESVCFGYLNSCRDIPVQNVREISGPMINLLICRLSLPGNAQVLSTLLENQDAYARSIEHQHFSLAEVMDSLNLSSQPLFNTAMSLQKESANLNPTYSSDINLGAAQGIDSTEYALTANIVTGEKRVSGDLTYWSHVVTDQQAELIADTFFHILSQLIDPANSHLENLDPLSEKNYNQLLQLNQLLPETVRTCIHTDIQKHSLEDPTASAVCAWDGDFTYAELDQVSTLLAEHLIKNGVGPEVFVPICCEKTRWVVAAVLGVLKAGGAFILLDPSHPVQRLRDMIAEFSCPILLTSTGDMELAAKTGPKVIVLEGLELRCDSNIAKRELVSTSPESAAYAAFSSGSTGRPKASVMEHQSFSSAVEAQRKSLCLHQGSRVLQFASYAFDASIVEILATLLVGGCVCIPSDTDRNMRLADSIRELGVNWALLTPSVSRILDPDKVCTLEILVLGGEGMSDDDVCRWSPHVHLMNAYGPSECSVIATAQSSPNCLSNDPSDIGHPVGGLIWVVNPQEPHKPVPVGAVGELLIEGPIVGRGYVNRPDHMEAAFLPYPAWLCRMRGKEGQGRLYRTGDLARCLPNGSVRYIGRKDRQVKLHGQRIELSEIEHHINQCWPEDSPQVFVDLVTPSNWNNKFLVASVEYQSEDASERAFQSAVEETKMRLQERVPNFLIPSTFLPVAAVPRLLNGKVDRRQLQKEASRALRLQMDRSSDGSQTARRTAQLTKEERTLQHLWAQVLHRPVDSIGPNDNFFTLGGDSILVMKLASTAGEQGVQISVPDVFLHPRLRNLAQLHTSLQRKEPQLPQEEQRQDGTVPPFSLLPPDRRANAQTEAMVQCGVSMEQIEDIYPCTALQAGLAALTAERPGSYIKRHRFRLAQNIHIERLKEAWEKVSARNGILRTRLIQSSLGCLQVEVRDCKLNWTVREHEVDETPDWEVIFGQELIHFEVYPVRKDGSHNDTGRLEMLITAHHAVYDSWSLPLLSQWAQLAYNDLDSPRLLDSTPFQKFIQYSMSQEKEALENWRAYLHDFDADPFPSLPSPSYRPQASKIIQISSRPGRLSSDMVSPTTAVRLAWALVQSQYQSSDKVVFGVVSSGRSAAVPGIETMAGPTIATIPLSVVFDGNVTVSRALVDLQERVLQLTPYEQVGLSQIAALGPEATRACSFQTLLIEARGDVKDDEDALIVARPLIDSRDRTSDTYAIQLTIALGSDEVTVEALFDDVVVPEWQMQHMLDQFSHILQQVHREPQSIVRDIPTLNTHDVQQLKTWNREITNIDHSTVVETIRKHCIARSSALAVCAWDGDFSYGELDARSEDLASLLISQRIGPEVFVPIYLERSCWTAVAVLGVLKAGAAFVLLDTFHPQGRLRTICEEIRATVIITSSHHQAEAQSLVPKTVLVTGSIKKPSMLVADCSSHPDPHRAALYAVFTSGSTGKPKAAVIENGSFVTMATPYARTMGINMRSRVLHFASYAFDISILEILGTLFAGACICILSEADRRDHLSQAVKQLQPSHAIFTPSLLRAITLADVQSVHTIMLIGEPVRTSDIQQWEGSVHLLNTYGPAECTVVFTMQSSTDPNGDARNIGSCIAGAGWVTDPRDPHRLVPIGAVGELLLQGPLVGRGYLNNPEQTATAFIPCPPWMRKLELVDDRGCSRFYRTGDLVRYEKDGTFSFVGRADCQVKLRGQRFELGEVEAQIQQHFPSEIEDVAAQIITPAGAVQSPYLAVFIALNGDSEAPGVPSLPIPSLDIVVPAGFGEQVTTVKDRLADILPEYMMPSAFIPLQHLPRTIGGKVDRRRLRESAATVTRQQMESLFFPMNASKKIIATDAQRTLQDIWARALCIPTEEVGVEDSFFRLGGNSISALQATTQARAVGINHSVADLFQWRTILQVAKRFAKSPQRTQANDPNVEDVFPCAPAQRGILLSQMQDDSSYAAHFLWQLRGQPAVCVARLVRAWQQVVSRHSALRVSFRPHLSNDGEFEQVLLRHIEAPVEVIEGDNDGDDHSPVPSVLTRHSITTVTQHDGQTIPHKLTICATSAGLTFCRLDINHVIVDTASLDILEHELCQAYDGLLPTRLQPDPYREYINFVQGEPEDEARTYWQSYLKGMKPLSFPSPRVTTTSQFADSVRLSEISLSHRGSEIEAFCRSTDWTASNLLYFAWAMALQAFTGSDDVCFGISTSGRLVPVPHIDQAVGQFSNMSICRVRLARHLPLNHAALRMQEEYSEILSYQSFPLVEIARAAGATLHDLASTAVNVQYTRASTPSAPVEKPSLTLNRLHGQDPAIQDIALYAEFQPDGQLRALITYQPSRVSDPLASQLGEYFDLAVSRILQRPHAVVGDLELLSDQDHQRLRTWNGKLSDPSPYCIHEIIQQHAMQQPDHIAISGWDGSFTYEDLDKQASRLSLYLTKCGISAAQPIPVCFEKSRWTIVAILAVMKAGGAFVPLDPTQPIARLREFCNRISSTIILSSVAQAALSRALCTKVIEVGDGMIPSHCNGRLDSARDKQTVDPEQGAYILFTSGTTGTPKAVVVSHASYLSSAMSQIRAFSLDPSSRFLQAASYAFDASVMEILTTLIAGATVCVISEPERNQMMLTGVCPFSVSHAFLTPSLARSLDANKASEWVQTLLIGGEPLSDSHITQWGTVCRLMHCYGSSESAVINTVSSDLLPGHDPRSIGRPVGVHCWIAEQHDHNRLVPVGAIGELILSGPPIGLGYLNDSEMTNDAFIQPPEWLSTVYPEQLPGWRLYKTGDLVRYDILDGSLLFEGRKDRQIKVRGQRVELEDIEYHVRRCFPGAEEAMIEQVMILEEPYPSSPETSSTRAAPRLVACIWDGLDDQSATVNGFAVNDAPLGESLLRAPSQEFHSAAAAALRRLRDDIPSYMVPDFYVSLTQVPRKISGKSDRQRLRKAIQAIQPMEWRAYSAAQRNKRPLESETAIKLHAILTGLLNVAPETVGGDDSFFHLGGDSILAMRVAANARAQGMEISSHHILRHATISDWANIVDSHSANASSSQRYAPYSLVSKHERERILSSYLVQGHPFTVDNVVDILPTVGFQSFYITHSSPVSTAKVFPTILDIDRLRSACRRVMLHHSVLRTFFVSLEDRLYQVVLRDVEPVFHVIETEDPEAYITQESQRYIPPSTAQGSLALEFTVVTDRNRSNCVFILRISHAQYDGPSLSHLWQAIASAYDGGVLPKTVQFSDVVYNRLSDTNAEAFSFWSKYLHGAPAAALDPLKITHTPMSPEHDVTISSARREITQLCLVPEITVSTLVKAALSWTLSHYTLQEDIIFGQVVHGRGCPIPDVDKVLGPCTNLLPTRISISPEWTVLDLLRHAQAQQLETLSYDYVSFEDIVEKCTNWPNNTSLGFLVHHEGVGLTSSFEMGGIRASSSSSWANSKIATQGQVGIVSMEHEMGLDLMITAAVDTLEESKVELLVDELASAIQLFSRFPNHPLSTLARQRTIQSGTTVLLN